MLYSEQILVGVQTTVVVDVEVNVEIETTVDGMVETQDAGKGTKRDDEEEHDIEAIISVRHAR